MNALARFGPCAEHRKTYQPVKDCLLPMFPCDAGVIVFCRGRHFHPGVAYSSHHPARVTGAILPAYRITDIIEDLMASILIKGGRVLSPEDNLDGALDVRIEDGVIREIGAEPCGRSG